MKVPLLIAYLKQAESDPQLLARRLAYNGVEPLPVQQITPSTVIEGGTPYPVDELLERMIASSDNRATAALLGAMDTKHLHRVFADLGLTVLDETQPDYAVSVKDYAGFFRVLFNASYLSREMSEQALDWLTKVEFRQGLVAGVPPGVVVAHKFGERTLGRTWQFHDCGIVYCPGSPYVLCVMSQGREMASLIGTTAEISRLVYGDVCQAPVAS